MRFEGKTLGKQLNYPEDTISNDLFFMDEN